MVDPGLIVLAVIIALGLAFDYINGFHDTANAIATSVATRVLSPGRAVAMAASLNFVGALTGTAVATTVGAGVAKGGWGAILPGGLDKTMRGLITSPVLGFVGAFAIMFGLIWAFHKV